MKISLVVVCLLFLTPSFAKTTKVAKAGKVQEINFDGSDVDGISRRPDGMYLVQKRNIDFVPLYKVRESFDKNIKESVSNLK